MCGALKRRFLLLYGTQKGQAKAIAEEISQQADHHGFLTDVFSLEDLEKFCLEKETDPVVIVISTTGTGDPPEAAVKFVRRIQNKDLPNDYLAHLRYGLLALGDSEYTFFCNGGKTVDKRLQELGAKHFYDTGYADDCVGLELVVDPWIEGLWVALKNELMSRTESQVPDGYTSSQTTQPVAEDLDQPMKMLKISSSLTPSVALQKGPDSPWTPIAALQKGSNSPWTPSVALQKGLDSVAPAEASLVRSVPPLSQSSLTVPSLPAPYLDVQILNCEGKEAELSSLYPKEAVFRVPIAEAKRLTTDGAVKTALMLELDISHTDVDLEPGDSFCVICPNPPDEVTELLNKLQLCERRSCQICLAVKADTKKRGASIPDYIPEKCSVDFVLTWCVEIRATPKKALIRALVEFTSDVAEKRRLQELCSKQGNSDYNRFIRDPSTTIVDLLTAFPSCRPPLGLVIEHLPKLQARPYSAASSKLFLPGKLRFVFNIVEFAAGLERREPRRGVCTGWLAELVRGSATIAETSDEDAAVPQICIFSRPSASFHLPSDTSVPLVMVGPGTGIAPFIGFLQHREKIRLQNKDWTFGETWLFFGCRSHDKDYLFREELSRFVENGSLTHLKVCFSRDPPGDTNENRPKYVQDFMKMYSKDLVRLLSSLNGILYVCGDAKNMAKDVNDALTDMISMELGVDRLEAMKTLASFRDRKQYLQDVWR